jgi:hypothetical protein
VQIINVATNVALCARLLSELGAIRLLTQSYARAVESGDAATATQMANQAIVLDQELSDPRIYELPIAGQA